MNIYTYEFATETTTIEISDEWASILEECDRSEYNNDQTETRRHSGYGAFGDEAGWLSTYKPAAFISIAGLIIDPKDKRFAKAYASLTEKQKALYEDVYVLGFNLKEHAERVGVSPAAATKLNKHVIKKFEEIFKKG